MVLKWHVKCIHLPLGNQSRQLLFHFQPDNFLGGEQICIPHRSVSTFLSGTVCRLLTSATLYLWLEQRSKPWWESTLDCECLLKDEINPSSNDPELLLWKLPHVSLKVSDKLLNEVQSRRQRVLREFIGRWSLVNQYAPLEDCGPQ